jgi:hypothetical protein
MLHQPPGNIATGDNKVTLGQVLDIHHAPHEGEAVGGERKQRTDHDSIENYFQIHDRKFKQQGNIA